MYVSARLDYALRALVTLSSDEGPVTAATLARRQGVSLAYVASILNELRRDGLVTHERGQHGGFRLARPPQQISVADVTAALRVWAVDTHTSASSDDAVGQCLAAVWARVGTVTFDVLASVTIADLAGGVPRVAPPAVGAAGYAGST